jgi:hypothetical protein
LKLVEGTGEEGENVIDDEKVEKDVIGGDEFGGGVLSKG